MGITEVVSQRLKRKILHVEYGVPQNTLPKPHRVSLCTMGSRVSESYPFPKKGKLDRETRTRRAESGDPDGREGSRPRGGCDRKVKEVEHPDPENED